MTQIILPCYSRLIHEIERSDTSTYTLIPLTVESSSCDEPSLFSDPTYLSAGSSSVSGLVDPLFSPDE